MALTLDNLPSEIVDLFIDQLEELDEDEALSSFLVCNMSCRAFRSRSRYHLFKRIRLSSRMQGKGNLPRKLEGLAEILKPQDDGVLHGIARYVESFEVVIDLEGIERGHMDYATLLKDEQGIMCGILNIFNSPDHSLRKLIIGFGSRPPSISFTVAWNEVSPDLQTAFVSICSSPLLQFLQLESISGLPVDLVGNSRLKHLHLTDIEFSMEVAMHNCLPKTLECIQLIPAKCLEGIQVDEVMALTAMSLIVTESKQVAVTWDLLKASAASLQDVSIHFFEASPIPGSGFHLNQISTLRTFTLTYTVTGEDGSGVAIFNPDVHNIYSFLDLPAPSTSLESVALLVNSWFDAFHDNGMTIPAACSLPGWNLIDTLLTSSRYPLLFHVSLTYNIAVLVENTIDYDQEAFKKKIRQFFAKALPNLHSSNTILFDLEIYLSCLQWGEVEPEL